MSYKFYFYITFLLCALGLSAVYAASTKAEDTCDLRLQQMETELLSLETIVLEINIKPRKLSRILRNTRLGKPWKIGKGCL